MQSNILSSKKSLKDHQFHPRAKISNRRSPNNSPSPAGEKYSPSRVKNLKKSPICENFQFAVPRSVLVTKSLKSRIKDFEEIGVFSDLIHPKNFRKDDSENSSHQTIHITDFMAKKQKIQLAQLAGLDSNYEVKKRGYRSRFLTRNQFISSFLTPSEKLPSFFCPQTSPKPVSDNDFESKSLIRVSQNPRVVQLDDIIEKCNQAISLRIKSSVP